MRDCAWCICVSVEGRGMEGGRQKVVWREGYQAQTAWSPDYALQSLQILVNSGVAVGLDRVTATKQ